MRRLGGVQFDFAGLETKQLNLFVRQDFSSLTVSFESEHWLNT